MRKVVSAAGLIIDNGRLLVIKHPKGYGFPKGHVEPDETLEVAAIREIREETGLETQIVRYVGKVNRFSFETNGEKVDKDIELFLMRVVGSSDEHPEEEFEWVAFDAAVQGMWHPEECDFLKAHAAALVGDKANS